MSGKINCCHSTQASYGSCQSTWAVTEKWSRRYHNGFCPLFTPCISLIILFGVVPFSKYQLIFIFVPDFISVILITGTNQIPLKSYRKFFFVCIIVQIFLINHPVAGTLCRISEGFAAPGNRVVGHAVFWGPYCIVYHAHLGDIPLSFTFLTKCKAKSWIGIIWVR